MAEKIVTGLSNALGGHEDSLIRNDLLQKEIQDILTEVFGHDLMGFAPSENPTADTFASDSDADSVNYSEEDESRNVTENVSVEGKCDASSDKYAVSCSGPDFEPFDSDCPSC